MTTEIIQDTINIQLKTETTVISDTVRIVVNISALVTTEDTEEKVRVEIKQALTNFISTDWQINGLTRVVDNSGYEKITLTAAARVSERENYNLEARAKAASRQGLQIANPLADTSVPQYSLDIAEREMRKDILIKAVAEAALASEVLGKTYRVYAVDFASHVRASSLKAMTASTSYGTGFGASANGLESAGDDSLSNAQKLALSADVTLAYQYV
jgi:hypothetical protein